MKPSHRAWPHRAILGALALLLLSCDSDGTRPTVPGEIRAVLDSPDGDVGAAVLELTGVHDLTAVTGLAFTERNGDALRAVIILDEPGQLEFRIQATDVTGTLGATVLDVSDANDETPPTLSGYNVRFVVR